MPRLLPTDKCPKCASAMRRVPTMIGSVFACPKCDSSDPIKSADKWINSELRPPSRSDAPAK